MPQPHIDDDTNAAVMRALVCQLLAHCHAEFNSEIRDELGRVGTVIKNPMLPARRVGAALNWAADIVARYAEGNPMSSPALTTAYAALSAAWVFAELGRYEAAMRACADAAGPLIPNSAKAWSDVAGRVCSIRGMFP